MVKKSVLEIRFYFGEVFNLEDNSPSASFLTLMERLDHISTLVFFWVIAIVTETYFNIYAF